MPALVKQLLSGKGAGFTLPSVHTRTNDNSEWSTNESDYLHRTKTRKLAWRACNHRLGTSLALYFFHTKQASTCHQTSVPMRGDQKVRRLILYTDKLILPFNICTFFTKLFSRIRANCQLSCQNGYKDIDYSIVHVLRTWRNLKLSSVTKSKSSK